MKESSNKVRQGEYFKNPHILQACVFFSFTHSLFDSPQQSANMVCHIQVPPMVTQWNASEVDISTVL